MHENQLLEKSSLDKFKDEYIKKLLKDKSVAHFLRNYKSICTNPMECGSCPLNFLPYEFQLDLKFNYVRQLFKVLAKVLGTPGMFNDVLDNLSIIPSIPSVYYRGRMDYAVDYSGYLGLKKKGSWSDVLAGHTCVLPLPVIKKVFELLNKIVPRYIKGYDRKTKKGFVSFIVIRGSLLQEVSVNFVIRKDRFKVLAIEQILKQFNRIVEILKELQQEIYKNNLPVKLKGGVIAVTESTREESTGLPIISVLVKDRQDMNISLFPQSVKSLFENQISQDIVLAFKEFFNNSGYALIEENKIVYIEEVINGVTFNIGPFSFFQPNNYTAGLLQREVARIINYLAKKYFMAADGKGLTILDLFGGQGFFGGFSHYVLSNIYLDKNIKTIVIDNDFVSIYLGQRAWLEFLSLTNLQNENLVFQTADAYDLNLPKSNILILDPPRRGLTRKLIKQINKDENIKYIVYVSCNVKQFVIEYKTHFYDYFKIKDIKLIDQFPQTTHVETIIVMERR